MIITLLVTSKRVQKEWSRFYHIVLETLWQRTTPLGCLGDKNPFEHLSDGILRSTCFRVLNLRSFDLQKLLFLFLTRGYTEKRYTFLPQTIHLPST